MEKETARVSMKEGSTMNYFEALHRFFGGEIGEDTYTVRNAEVYIRMCSYAIEPQMELIISEARYERNIIIDRVPDGDPDYVHLYLILEGRYTQSFDSREVKMEAGTVKGAFIYNGLFPLSATFPGGSLLRSIGFKLKRESLETLLPEALPIFQELFGAREGIAYHTHIPAALEKLGEEMFRYRDAEFGSRAMVMARGIETFAEVFRTVNRLREKRQLNGLHVDDFNRLQRIKERILSNVDERISLNNLAKEYGISVSKLKRDFKTLFECSVYQFYTHARMDEAYRRLKSGEYSVMEVGYDLGYQNLSKFSEMFKKVKGISPKEVI